MRRTFDFDETTRKATTAAILASAFAAAVWTAPSAVAQEDVNPVSMAMERFHADSYQAGDTFGIQIRISASANEGIQALGLRETLPSGWAFAGMTGVTGDLPAVSPSPGTEQLLEFAWISIPQLPYTFAYNVTIPEDDPGGSQVIHGSLEYRLSGPAQYAPPVITQVNGVDRTPPVITLTGGSSMQVSQGDGWSEPGYKATDNVDGDLTGQVQVSGDVDTSSPGNYSITYSVSDSAGNRGSAVRRVQVRGRTATGVPTPDRPVGGGVGTGSGTGSTPGSSDGAGGTAGGNTGMTTPAIPGQPNRQANSDKQAAATPATPSQGSLNMRPGVYSGNTPGSGIVIPETDGSSPVAATPGVIPRPDGGGSASGGAGAARAGVSSSGGTASGEDEKKKLSDEWPQLAQTAPAEVPSSLPALVDGMAGRGPITAGPQGLAGNIMVVAGVALACVLGLGASTLAARSVYGGRRRRTIPPK